MHHEVEIIDAITAVMLLEMSLERSSSLFWLDFNLNANFPENPKQQHEEITEIILRKLNLLDLLINRNNNTAESTVQMNESCSINANSSMSDIHTQNESKEASSECKNCLEKRFASKHDYNEESIFRKNSDSIYLSNNQPDTENKTISEDIKIKKRITCNNTFSVKNCALKNTSNNTEIDSGYLSPDISLKENKNTTILDSESCLEIHKESNLKLKPKGRRINLEQFRFKPRDQPQENEKKPLHDIQLLNLIPSVNDDIYNVDVDMEDVSASFGASVPKQLESVSKDMLSGKAMSVFEEGFDDSDLNI